MSDTPFGDENAALLALDALPSDEQVGAEPHIAISMLQPGLADAAGLLAEQTVTDPPSRLRSGTLAFALSRRPPGRPVDAAEPCEPAVAFDRTIADMNHLLGSLTDAEWDAPAHVEHGQVRDLIAHLVGVERLVLRWLDPQDTVPDLPDHVQATRPVVTELAGADPHDVARQWYEAARAVADAAAGDRTRTVVFHDLTLSVDELFVMRTGELWAHAIDICRAVGRPLPQLDAERMAMFCAELMAAVPLAMAYGGTTAPGRAARFVLTGPAGGTFTVPLAPLAPVAARGPRAAEPQAQATEPAVTIVADAVGLCQLAVRRLRPHELHAAIDGDRALGDLVLAGMGALARD